MRLLITMEYQHTSQVSLDFSTPVTQQEMVLILLLSDREILHLTFW